MASNRRVTYRSAGGPRVIGLIEEDMPEPAPHEVRVRVEAAGVAFADIIQRNGSYPGQPAFPMTPGYDICGRVDAVGREAGRRLAKGQRVAGVTVFGGYADYVCVEPDYLVPVPEGLDAAEVVALCLNYVTASQMMHRLAAVEPDDAVLIHAAGGGVGTALLELGGLYELTMYGTVSRAKARTVEALGGIPIDYKDRDFVDEIARYTDGQGVMAAFDAIGGRHALRSAQALSPNGRLVVYGSTQGFAGGRRRLMTMLSDYLFASLSVVPLFADAHSILTYNMQRLREARPSWYREDLTLLINHLEAGRLQPVIAGRYPLEDARAAQESFIATRPAGKMVLLCAGAASANNRAPLLKAAE